MSLTIPTGLSPSAASTFATCGQQFKFCYIDRLPDGEDSASQVLGNLVHDALFRFYYKGRLIQDAYVDACTAAPQHLLTKEIVEDACEQIQNLFKIEDPTTIHPMGCELRLEVELDGVSWRGIIDRVDWTPFGAVIVDYKTGKVPDMRRVRERMEGVLAYCLMWEEMTGQRPAGAQLYYLKAPRVFNIPVTDHTLDGQRRRLAALWQGIETACEEESFRPHVSPLCPHCSYQEVCPAWEGKL